MATWPSMPQQNENHRLVRMLLRRAELVDSAIMAVEQSSYFPGGRSPVHAEKATEEVIYFKRGRGQVLLGTEFVDVGPGDAVAIPSGITHQVVNTGEDYFEHVLISAELTTTFASPDVDVDLAGTQLIGGAASRLRRLSCSRQVLEMGERSAEVHLPAHELVYAVSSGAVVAHVAVPDRSYEWQFVFDSSHVFWLPADLPHHFRNVGDAPAQLVSFPCVAT